MIVYASVPFDSSGCNPEREVKIATNQSIMPIRLIQNRQLKLHT